MMLLAAESRTPNVGPAVHTKQVARPTFGAPGAPGESAGCTSSLLRAVGRSSVSSCRSQASSFPLATPRRDGVLATSAPNAALLRLDLNPLSSSDSSVPFVVNTAPPPPSASLSSKVLDWRDSLQSREPVQAWWNKAPAGRQSNTQGSAVLQTAAFTIGSCHSAAGS